MGAAPRDRQGVAGAMGATARNLGMALGIALAVSLQRHRLGFAEASWPPPRWLESASSSPSSVRRHRLEREPREMHKEEAEEKREGGVIRDLLFEIEAQWGEVRLTLSSESRAINSGSRLPLAFLCFLRFL